ncbi:hypothetical protein ND972_16400 [Vibrio diabolicus]|uniref:hypothetical protein n=1 Tax=Vibrio diabolicus TaxID=50719 RepID=UPI00215E4B5E|nr:hypothetical protein [Vibrio diabolicus]MCS0398363.1 hypothetical protein [Vibrio diabolicus]
MKTVIHIDKTEITQQPLASQILCRNLLNPRGMTFNENGDLIVVEAGSGQDTVSHNGKVTVRDKDTGKLKHTLLNSLTAMNMQPKMCRDEIMGLSDIINATDTEQEQWLVSFTDYIHGSKVFHLNDTGTEPLFETQGNINSLCFHPKQDAWYGVKPDTNQVIEFRLNQKEKVVCALPTLDQGQEAVPVNIIYCHDNDRLLISLFSGELQTDSNKQGVNFLKQQGKIVALDVGSGALTTVVEGLTLPTGIAIDQTGNLLITELCKTTLEPLPRDHIPDRAIHGGYQRFSGRLLSVDFANKKVKELASQLDTPSNIAILGSNIYVSQGMGAHGRRIPHPDGERALDGFIQIFQGNC